jgi:hypothetical protein
MPYDADFAKEFKPIAHALGLTAKQAAGVHDFYVGKAGNGFTATAEARVKQANDATAALEAKWGKPDSDGFQAKVDSTMRALKGLDIEADLQAVGLLGVSEVGGKKVSVVTNPKIAFALADIGEKLYREGGLLQGGGGVAADNPFKDGFGKGNTTTQMQAIKADKVAAIRQIRAAGHDPKAWGLTE